MLYFECFGTNGWIFWCELVCCGGGGALIYITVTQITRYWGGGGAHLHHGYANNKILGGPLIYITVTQFSSLDRTKETLTGFKEDNKIPTRYKKDTNLFLCKTIKILLNRCNTRQLLLELCLCMQKLPSYTN